jgi:hypothetical protein
MRKVLNLAIQNMTEIGIKIFGKRSEKRLYPSRRPCPICGGKMFYLASRWSRRRHARTCESCSYSDEKVKIITRI